MATSGDINMRLHDPLFLVLLVLLPLVVMLARSRSRDASLRFSDLTVVSLLPRSRKNKWRAVLPLLRSAALCLLVVALARPQAGITESKYRGQGIDIILAVDVSGSMLSEDFHLRGDRVSRLAVVKSVVEDFVKAREGDRIGLMLFSSRPYSQCPLTLDHGWLLRNLRRAEVGMISDGTAIGSALAAAAGRLEPSVASSKIVILLTDGQSNAGSVSPLTAAAAAAVLDIKVYTVGAGTRGMAPYPSQDLFGNTIYRPVKVDIDEEMLSEVALITGGKYFRATDTSSLQSVYETIDELETTTFSAPQYQDYLELYPWCVALAGCLIALEQMLNNTVLRKLP